MTLKTSGEMIAVGLVVALISTEILLLSLLVGYRTRSNSEAEAALHTNAELVRQMGLTDLSIWSGARYARHPSQADLFSPFGDHPSSMEHFPCGSIFPPNGRFLAESTVLLNEENGR